MKNQIDGENLDFMHQPSFNQPKSLLSQSEIKSPTINSSFFQNFRSYHDQPSPYPKLQSLSHIKDDHTKFMINDPSTQIFKQYYTKQKIIRSPEERHRQVRNLVKKFAELVILIEQAYIYKETLFNTFQRTLMTEKYLEPDNYEFHQNGEQFIIYRVIWDLLYFLLITLLLIQLPLQMGLELLNSKLEGFIIIPIIIIDIVMNYYESKQYYFQFNKINKVEVVYLISYSLIQGTNIFTTEIVITSHKMQNNLNLLFYQFLIQINLRYMISFFSGLIKVYQLLEKNKIYFSFNLSPFINLFILIIIIHFSACIWLYLGIEDNSWVSDYNLKEKDNFTKYCHALYWSTATLLNLGQSQITATTQAELLYSSFIMFLSGFVLAYLFIITNEFLKESNKKESIKRKQIRIINKFLNNRGLSVEIKSRIRGYFNNFQQNQEDQVHISQLPKAIGEQLQIYIRKEAMEKCQFLKNFSYNSRNKLLSLIEYQSYNTDSLKIFFTFSNVCLKTNLLFIFKQPNKKTAFLAVRMNLFPQLHQISQTVVGLMFMSINNLYIN